MSFVAVVLYPGCVFFEVALAAEVAAAKFPVRAYSPDGNAHAASNGLAVEVAGSFGDLSSTPAKAVLVPGGDPRSILVPRALASEALQFQHNSGALIASICAGNLIVAASGLLVGRSGTHNYTVEHTSAEKVAATASYWNGMKFTRADLVRDGAIVTAQPWAYRKLAAEIGVALGLLDQDEAGLLSNYTSRRSYGDA